MTGQEEILEVLKNEHPGCLAAHHIAERLGSTSHYSSPPAKQFIKEIEDDLEALAATDPPRVTHELKRYDMRFEGGPTPLRCWRAVSPT